MRRTIDQASTAFTMEIGIWSGKATRGGKKSILNQQIAAARLASDRGIAARG
jgi:hypothetical protein